jgi:two-component system sensor histidine kinase KdpD
VIRAKGILKNIVITIAILSAVTGLSLLLDQLDDVTHSDAYVSMIFILAVFIISRMTDGYFYGVAASVYGVLTVNYFFTYPYFAFNFSMPGYPITMVTLFTVSTLTCALTTRMKRQEQARAEAEKERLRGDLLRAVSHDFRTPLTSIIGANSALSEDGDVLTPEQKRALHGSIEKEAQWLQRMVENLLSVTRFSDESGARVAKTPEAVEEVLAAAAEKFGARHPGLFVQVTAPEELLICPMDALLIEQLLLNLLQNAAQHATHATRVEMTASRAGANAKISVSDDGCGMKKEQIARVLKGRPADGRMQADAHRNMGIGLSVCAAIAAAHGGSLRLENRANGGLTATLLLPLEG